jgi:predicted amidophosphoribosyltransferase
MILSGDYMKILKGFYKGEIGIIKSFDGFSYRIKLLKKDLEIKVEENGFEIISENDFEDEAIKIKLDDGTEIFLKDIDLRFSSKCLKNNGYFKGLYALGKYYAKKEYTEKYYSDYFTRQILKIKNFNKTSAEDIAKIYLNFIDKSKILQEIVKKIDYTCFMPNLNKKNHVEQWGRVLCEKLGFKDISYIIKIQNNKRKALRNYKFKYASDRHGIINGAFQIRNNTLNLKNKSCLILDDVCTTGLQINEIAITLANVGVKEIYAFVIGRAKY